MLRHNSSFLWRTRENVSLTGFLNHCPCVVEGYKMQDTKVIKVLSPKCKTGKCISTIFTYLQARTKHFLPVSPASVLDY